MAATNFQPLTIAPTGTLDRGQSATGRPNLTPGCARDKLGEINNQSLGTDTPSFLLKTTGTSFEMVCYFAGLTEGEDP